MGTIDSQLLYSDKQTLAAADSTNTIDLKYKFNGTAGFLQLIGFGITGATAVTVTIKDSPDGVTFTSRETQTFTTADTNSGQAAIALAKPLQRFSKLSYTLTGTITAGVITAFITNTLERASIYPTNRT